MTPIARIVSNRGFTLIEMLTVIAIIGILSSVTFASLSSARSNARDKSIQASMQGILVEASLFRARNNTYDNGTVDVCTDAEYIKLRDKIDTDNGGTYTAPTCESSATAFGVVVRLNNGTYYCVDSTKYFGSDANGVIPTSGGSAYRCEP